MVLEDIPVPELQAGDVLVKVKACGICGSDVHGAMGMTGRRVEGVVMGHEFAAEVVKMADDVTGWNIGDKVVVEPCKNCCNCVFCENGRTQYCPNKGFLGVFDVNGAYAEYVAIPARSLLKLPDDMTFEEGALIEPLAVSKVGVEKVADYTGKTVVVVGAGTIGLLAVAVLKSKNPAQIIVTDLSENRLDAARKLGVDHALNPRTCDVVAKIKELTNGYGADVSIECVGLEKSVQQALAVLRPEGHSVWIGASAKDITINMQTVVAGGLTVYGTYTYSHQEFADTLYAYKAMKIPTDDIISCRVTMEQIPDMIMDLASGNDKIIKAMVVMD